MDSEHMLDLLPNRYPFLMVDRILSRDTHEIVTLKNVTNNEPYFQGHFPENPIMPGVMILEAMFQTSGLCLGQPDAPADDRLAYVTTVDKVKFRKPVVPGDQLVIKVVMLSRLGTAVRFSGTAFVADLLVAEATWMSMLATPDVTVV